MTQYCLIMAGGSGTRFWPESTQERPKQYLNLTGEGTLLECTLKRFESLVEPQNRFIVTTRNQEQLARECSLNLVAPHGIILEPASRNTAPCILLSLAWLLRLGAQPSDLVTIVPADHVILNLPGYQKTLQEAAQLAAQSSQILTIGIPPHFPHTGFGYIQKDRPFASHQNKNKNCFQVKKFKEKPDFPTAKEYVSSGQYFWNAGMFVATVGVLLDQFQKHAPSLFAQLENLRDHLDQPERLKEIYGNLESISVDYAIMEKSSEIMVVGAEFDWNDLGSWDALESVCKKVDGNVLVSKESQHFFKDAHNNIVLGLPGQFVSLVNVSDLIVVSNERALMVVPKKDAQRIKEIVEYLKKTDQVSFL